MKYPSFLPLILLAPWSGGTAVAWAAAPVGPDYTVQADTISAGGGLSVSADYGQEGSLGGVGGVADGMTARIEHGYINQLRNPVKSS